jgi:protein-disulfide isomerase
MKNRSILAVVILCALGAAAVALWYARQDSAPGVAGMQPAEETVVESPAAPADAVVIPDMELGNPDAEVTVIEYASFTCPHCARFHTETFPRLMADYIETGRIRFVYREVFFDRYALWAALVARCGGPERYFGIAGELYRSQQDWRALTDPMAAAEGMRKAGRLAGLDDATLNACLQDKATAEAMIAKYEADTKADGVTSTPSFVIDGKLHSNAPYEDLRALIDAALAE